MKGVLWKMSFNPILMTIENAFAANVLPLFQSHYTSWGASGITDTQATPSWSYRLRSLALVAALVSLKLMFFTTDYFWSIFV